MEKKIESKAKKLKHLGSISQKFYFALGLISLVMGFIGIFLPIWPTTPFIIISAWAFEKGSPRLHRWLVGHPIVGPPLVKWQKYGVISKRAKWISIITLVCSFSFVILTRPILLWMKVFLAVIGITVILFIATRPSKISPPISSSF